MGEPPGFAAFWEPYWKKVSKADAEAAWRKLDPSPDLQRDIVAAVTSQRPAMLRAERKYQPHASTWLNGKRWTDEVTSVDDGPQYRRLDNGHPPARNFREEATANAFEVARAQRDLLKGGKL